MITLVHAQQRQQKSSSSWIGKFSSRGLFGFRQMLPLQITICLDRNFYLADIHFKTVDDIRKCLDEFYCLKIVKFPDGIASYPKNGNKVIDNNGEYFDN